MPKVTRTEPDDKLVPYMLTESWEISPDGKTISLVVPSSIVIASWDWGSYALSYFETELGIPNTKCSDYSDKNGVSITGEIRGEGNNREGIMIIEIRGQKNIWELNEFRDDYMFTRRTERDRGRRAQIRLTP